MPKTWAQKFQGARPAHAVALEKPFAGVAAGQRLVIPSPALLAERIGALPRGIAIDPVALRGELARAHGADATCRATTAIHLRIVAERALGQIAVGQDATPFWRDILSENSPCTATIRMVAGVNQDERGGGWREVGRRRSVG